MTFSAVPAESPTPPWSRRPPGRARSGTRAVAEATGPADPATAVTVGYVHEKNIAASFHHCMIEMIGWDLAHEARIIRGGYKAWTCGTDGLVDSRNKLVAGSWPSTRPTGCSGSTPTWGSRRTPLTGSWPRPTRRAAGRGRPVLHAAGRDLGRDGRLAVPRHPHRVRLDRPGRHQGRWDSASGGTTRPTS